MQFFPQWRNLAPTIPLLTAAIALAGCASGVPADDTTATP